MDSETLALIKELVLVALGIFFFGMVFLGLVARWEKKHIYDVHDCD